MSGPLKNPRHERFVALLLQGESAVDAHEHAGYGRDDGNAARLRANPKVVERLTELQSQVAAETQVTIQGLLNELEAVRQKATDLKQLSAAVKAISEKAKISGLLVQKVEVGGPGSFSFDHCNSIEAIADDLLHYFQRGPVVAAKEEKQGLVDLLNRHNQETHEYIAAIAAKPVTAVDAAQIERKRLTNERRKLFGNGKAPSVT
jgi:hypothetical protein